MISIVGLSPSTRHLVPADSEIWALPWDAEYASRATKLFEMHDRGLLEHPDSLRPKTYFDDLAQFEQPVYMHRHWPDIPASVAFPLSELEKTVFAGFPRARWSDQKDWYNSSPAYMMALAIHENKDFGLFGIDVLDESEFSYESPCLEYLIGLAVGRGLTVTIPEGPTALGKFRGEGIKLGTMNPIYKDRYGYVA